MIHLTSQPLTPKEIIQHVFSPLIGVLCSPQADELCHKNNLSFVELLQPFSKLTTDAYIRDAAGVSTSVKGIRLNFCDVNWRPPQTLVARKMLTDTVTSAQSTKTKPIQIDDQTFIDIPIAEPWFEQWREIFLSVQSQSDHEFTRHFLGSLIVLSSSDPNTLETAHLLTRRVQTLQNATPPKVPKWFTTDALNCYVLLHDPTIQGNVTSAQQAFETLKLTFGDNKCFLVQINSQQTPSTNDIIDPWLKFLRRQPKMDDVSEAGSAPKTPQDVTSISSMPLTVQMSTLETPPPGTVAIEEMVDHPLSPTQEQVSDSIHSKFSSSLDSLSSQTQIVNPNVWESITDAKRGIYLTATDIDNIKHLVQDLSIRALIPYVEKQIVLLNDTVSNKKSVSRSLLSATKRFFATKPGASSQTENVVVYSSDSSLELQTRKLGDLHFLFGNYSQAFQHYHQVKRDFQVDSAWQYYAGALEMAGLSAFLANVTNASNQKAFAYLEEAIVVYLNQCKLQNLAIRCTLLSVELLKSVQLYTEGARQFIRMTSTDADLMSGLLLEQSAYLFLKSTPSQFRKYAFHVVLAGHRYSKSGQRKHSFRCYRQANQIFQNRGWDLAESHIFYTLSKQAITLKKVDEAVVALAHLLRPSNLQSASQQASFLSEYIATQKMFLKQSNNADVLLDIGLPKVVKTSVRVLISGPSPITVPGLDAASNININMSQSETADEWKWNKLEWIAAQSASSRSIMIFKPNRSLFTYQMPTSDSPLSIQGEPIEISFALENTIKPPITFDDINLLWTFTNPNGNTFTNSNLFKNEISVEDRNSICNIVASTFIKQIKLNEHEKKVVVMKLTPHHIGKLQIRAVVGKLSTKDTSSLWGKIDFESPIIKPDGPSSADKPIQHDQKLNMTILPPAPALLVKFTQIPTEVLAGEIIPITVFLTNAGSEPLHDIWVVSDEPRWILGESDSQELPLSLLRDFKDLTNEALSRDREACKQHAFKMFPSLASTLQPKENRTARIWLQAPFKKGQTILKLLFYYETPAQQTPRYRLVRHSWNLNVNESLSLDATCTLNNATSNDLGIDLYVKNQNQVHHALVTEIFLSDLTLFCPTYKFIPDSIKYLQSPGYNRVVAQNKGLRINESISLKCYINRSEAMAKPTKPLEFIQNRLSNLPIKPIANVYDSVPNPKKFNSFLMKNETKFIGVLKQTSNSEEFNQIASMSDPHMTLALTWTATVNDNNSAQRVTCGQHFVQLRNIYETINCPAISAGQLQSHEQKISIYTTEHSTPSTTKRTTIPDESDRQWGPNDVNVLTRCFLEVKEDDITTGATTSINAVN